MRQPTSQSGFMFALYKDMKSAISSPVLAAMLLTLYISVLAAIYLYHRQELETADLMAQVNRERAVAAAKQQQVELFAAATAFRSDESIDIFRNLSFEETSPPADRDKLDTALRLNSFARYALDSRDFQKAKDTLDESLGILPTAQARYYLGLLAFLEHDYKQAISLWQEISRSKSAPDDIWLYMSLAEYRLGNTADAGKFASRFAAAVSR